MINEEININDNENTKEVIVNNVIESTTKEKNDSIDTNEKHENFDYLSKDVLDVKKYSIDEANDLNTNSKSEKIIDEKLYDDELSDIQEKQVIKGTVVGNNDKGVIIDIGFKSEGVIDKNEFDKLPDIGEEVDVFLITFENKKGQMILSKEKADFTKRWDELRNAFKDESIIKGNILKRIKGGFVVDLGVVNAFLPGSQIDVQSVTDYDQYLGNEYEFKIVKFNEFRQNIVVSRKAILSGDVDEQKMKLLEKIEVGETYDGMVKNITDFGAFIDLGGIDGLLHITDITWGRINHPSEKVSLGEKIKVKIIDFDEKTTRISLGTKQLTKDPWQDAISKYEVDSVVNGKVVNLMTYGMFIEIAEGVEGLIHISEMSWTKHIKHPSDMYKIGDNIDAKVLTINADDKKISLGIKQLLDNPWDNIEDKIKVGDEYEGTIKNEVQNGSYISINEDVEGFLYNNDLSWTRKFKSIYDCFDKQDTVKVKVIEVSGKDKKISLSHKHLSNDPWENIESDISLNEDISAKVLYMLDNSIICLFNDIYEGILPHTNIDNHYINSIKENDEITIKIIEINNEKRRLVLTYVPQDNSDVNAESTDDETEKEEKIVEDKVVDIVDQKESVDNNDVDENADN